MEAVAPGRLGAPVRRLLVGFWTSNLGDGVGLAAAPLLVAAQTRDPLLIALAPLLQQLPWLLFGLYAGAIADRVDRRRLLVGANLARGAVIGVVAVLIAVDRETIAIVLVATFLFGVAECFADTVAGTLLPMLVSAEDLGVGNNRLQAGNITLNQLVGPPVGAALFGLGMAVPFAAEAVLMWLASITLIRLVLPPADVADRGNETTRIRDDILDGARWLWRNDAVRTLALVILSFNVTFGAAWAVLVLYAQDRLGMGDVGFGLLTTASALGGLLSAAFYDRIERRFSYGGIMRVCLTMEVLMHLALAIATRAWMGLLILFGFGAYAHVWATVSTSVRQRAVPTEFQGRVTSVYLVSVFGGMAAGSGLGAVIAKLYGITAPFWFAFVATAVILAVVWPKLPRIASTTAQEPPAASPSSSDTSAR